MTEEMKQALDAADDHYLELVQSGLTTAHLCDHIRDRKHRRTSEPTVMSPVLEDTQTPYTAYTLATEDKESDVDSATA